MASMVSGQSRFVTVIADFKMESACGVVRIGRRRAVTRVKKNVPPGAKARRYSGMVVQDNWGSRENPRWWVDTADPPYGLIHVAKEELKAEERKYAKAKRIRQKKQKPKN
jgi:hypothetical protein